MLELAAQFGIAGFSIFIIFQIYKITIENQKQVFDQLNKTLEGLKNEFKEQKNEFCELKEEIIRRL
jgi:cell division protein FtsB